MDGCTQKRIEGVHIQQWGESKGVQALQTGSIAPEGRRARVQRQRWGRIESEDAAIEGRREARTRINAQAKLMVTCSRDGLLDDVKPACPVLC